MRLLRRFQILIYNNQRHFLSATTEKQQMDFTYKFLLIMVICKTSRCMVDNVHDTKGRGNEKRLNDRDGKLFNVFTVVRFPNDPCAGSSSRNGTCYTEAECTSHSGSNEGSCAQGFGVCCVFVAGCGQSVAENCTYFEYSGSDSGGCSLEICPCSSGICQMRLDFTNFVITGPSTATITQVMEVNGVISAAGGKSVNYQGSCLTDTFTVTGSGTGQNTPPTICGTNTGEHMYADMDNNNCNSLDFARGSAGVYATVPTTRTWSIKVTQISCQSELRAPQGCTQYYYGKTTDKVQTYNYNTGLGEHLANQKQNICVRQERGYCQICWSATSAISFDLTGLVNAAAGVLGGYCCNYGTTNLGMGTLGWDCLVIPGAKKGTASAALVDGQRFCGHSEGLVDGVAAGAVETTICTKQQPFSIQFLSDATENADNANAESAEGNAATMPVPGMAGSGFELGYFLKNTGC